MPAPRMNTDEYLSTPETLLPQELVYGFVRDAAAPAPGHQSTVLRLLLALVFHVAERGFGRVWPSPIDVVLDRERGLVVQPDIIVVSNQRMHFVSDRVWGAPDLVVEVLSPRPRIGDLAERLDWFAAYGVRECWLVYQPERALEVVGFADGKVASRRRFTGDSRVESGVLPDFDRPVDAILDEPQA